MYYYLKKKLYFFRLRKLQRITIRQFKKVHDYFVNQADYHIKIKMHEADLGQIYYRIYFSTDNINWKYLDIQKYLDVKDVFSEWKTKLCFSPREAISCSCPVQQNTYKLFNERYPDEFVCEFIYSKDAIIPIAI